MMMIMTCFNLLKDLKDSPYYFLSLNLMILLTVCLFTVFEAIKNGLSIYLNNYLNINLKADLKTN